jgi:hypothetical protein
VNLAGRFLCTTKHCFCRQAGEHAKECLKFVNRPSSGGGRRQHAGNVSSLLWTGGSQGQRHGDDSSLGDRKRDVRKPSLPLRISCLSFLIAYHLLRYGGIYRELGGSYYDSLHPRRTRNMLIRRLSLSGR